MCVEHHFERTEVAGTRFQFGEQSPTETATPRNGTQVEMLQLESPAIGAPRNKEPDSAASEIPGIVARRDEEDAPGREEMLRLRRSGAVGALLGGKSSGATVEIFGEKFSGDRLVDSGFLPLLHPIILSERAW